MAENVTPDASANARVRPGGAKPEGQDAAQADAAQSDAAQSGAEARDGAAQGAPQADAEAPRRRVYEPDAPRDETADAATEAPDQEAMEEDFGDVEDFAAMLAEQSMPEMRGLDVGDRVEGEVVSVGTDAIFIDVGSKTEAFMERAELLDADGQLSVQVGDRVKGIVVERRGGQVRVSGSMPRGEASKQMIEEAFASGIPVEGVVSSTNKGGYEVDVMGQRAFCPLSQIEQSYTADPEQHVGQRYLFKIIEHKQGGRRLVVSRAELQREESEQAAASLRERLHVGAILEGEVRSVQDYGAFVDLGGLDGLVHVSELTHGHVSHPSEAVSEGQKVQVKVLSIEQTKKGERIGLSIRQTELDPWQGAAEWLTMGETYTGTVVRLAPFGAFVELQPGIEGLVHVSEMSWEKRVHHPKDVVQTGDQVDVVVISLDVPAQRIGLSLKAALGNPWEGAEERYTVGEAVTGTIERIADFGLFVRLEAGVVALVPLSELGTQPGVPPQRDFTAGDEVEAAVLSVDEERRRLTLSRKALSEGARPQAEAGAGAARRGGGRGPRSQGRERDRDRGRGGATTSYREAGGNFATLGDLLKNKLNPAQEND